MKRFSENHPVGIAYILIFIIFSLRILDVFVIRSDELFGEQVLTKIVGLVLILVYVWSVKGSFGSIGLYSRYWKFSVMLGLLVMAMGLFTGYGAEWLYLYVTGAYPKLFVAAQGHALIPENAVTGGLLFGITLFAGNVINSFMEEGLFRGMLITHLGSRISLRKTNLVQAFLFGIWHIVWPIRDYLDGQTDLSMALGTSAGYIVLSGLIGFAWGYFYQKTNSLWTSWSAHTLNNTVMNFFHITTTSGAPLTLGLRAGVATLVVVALLPFVRKVAETRTMPEIKTWG